MTFHELQAQTIDGEEFEFQKLAGQRVLVVNTASECGYTPQYEQLQELYETYGSSDFTIIAFPSNDFGGQEPGSNADIKSFCQKNYGVTFPVMAKAPVTGPQQHPVYRWLTSKERNGRKTIEVEWNFNKFLINAKGEWVAYYPSSVSPLSDEIVSFAEGEKFQP